MVELEILFSSGQGILVPMEDRESALLFMKRAMEYDPDAKVGLFHLSTPYEEVLLDINDISFIRLKKENYPRLSTTLKIPEHTSFHEEEHPGRDRAEHETAIRHRREAEQSGDERTFMVEPDGTIKSRVTDSYNRAEDRLRQAEERLGQVEAQRRKVETELRRTTEEFEDAAREAELRKKVENLEIDREIKQMKDQQNG
ncbi:MAG: hypothetical protein ACAI44_03740 [Candidatus Sericytochromatia bacterium]